MTAPAWWNETEQEIFKRTLSQVDKRWDKREGGFIYDVLKPLSIVRSEQREEFKKWYHTRFAQYATGDDLDAVVESRTPLKRYPAKKAKGKVTVSGNEGTKLAKGSVYVAVRYDLDNKIIEYTQLADATIGPNGNTIVEIEAVLPGLIGNTSENTIELIEAVFGVAKVTNVEKITGGEEKESDEDLRSRYFTWLRESSNSGNIGDYIRWSLSIPDVGGVLVFPVAKGKGTVQLSVCNTSFTPASPELVKRVQDYIAPSNEMGEGQAPIGASVSVVAAIPVKVNLAVYVSSKQEAEALKQQLIEGINEYFKFTNRLYWRENARKQSILKEPYQISYLKVGSVAVDVMQLIRVNRLLMNGEQKDVTIQSGQIAVLGDVIFYEGT
ncbi:baseplate J/gp47 family protein [Bacillus pacificus]|uniref:baseplate J/gp47 family protein n=2 Tax=Bacillus pacificus TaxID=2026187 RepID=UPI001D0EEDE5|nr:baseplate J/gp47 family protein [Bacillus pacificus]MCC2351972.1 baseplate J/gp47 family protein [Bacillus pacificus]MCU5247319.1 baseplate J/gp47 family protein [Bacillus pacificus]